MICNTGTLWGISQCSRGPSGMYLLEILLEILFESLVGTT